MSRQKGFIKHVFRFVKIYVYSGLYRTNFFVKGSSMSAEDGRLNFFLYVNMLFSSEFASVGSRLTIEFSYVSFAICCLYPYLSKNQNVLSF